MSSSHKVIEDFINLQQRNALVHVVRVAVDLGILGALVSGQKSLQQLAEELKLQPIPLQKLMNVLENSELIERYQDDYALSSLARLIPTPYLDFGDNYWSHLEEFIRTGKSMVGTLKSKSENQESISGGSVGEITQEPQEPLERTNNEVFHPYLEHPYLDYRLQKLSESWMLTPQALELAQLLDFGRSRRSLRILELGSGVGVFSATLAHQDPNSVINLLDTKEGADKSRITIESLSLQRQADVIEVDNLLQLDSVDELEGQQYDLFVLPGLIHRFEIGQLEELLSQLRKFANKDSEISIIDVFSGQEGAETVFSIFDLELQLRTTTGTLHEPHELTVLLKKTGWGDIQFAYLRSPPPIWGVFLARIVD